MDFSGEGQADRRGRRCQRVVIAGTGGQGVLTAARLLSEVSVERGHEVVSGQLHGMAQRGGSVQASVIIDGGISPVISQGRADVVLGFEPVEAARALPLMSAHTLVLLNTTPIVPFVLAQRAALHRNGAKYPNVDALVTAMRAVTDRVHCFDATDIAKEAGSAKALNMVMLGCLLGYGALACPSEEFWKSASRRMPRGSADINGRAFALGSALGKNLGLSTVAS
jgi:indolepyruvate ferredoxin oxidoreductase beta subunit